LEKYLSHPEVGAEELRKVKSFDPTVIQAVSQHHFRKNDKGFPTKTNRAYIHVCAEIIGICDDFDYLCRRKAANEPTLDLKREMEKRTLTLKFLQKTWKTNLNELQNLE
jgi:HD-GYP domain-containing protein (c-di-GMP phosphodiesterase class II)